MEQFFWGFLAGMAVGMWMAILLYVAVNGRRSGEARSPDDADARAKRTTSVAVDSAAVTVAGAKAAQRHHRERRELRLPDDSVLLAPARVLPHAEERILPRIEDAQVRVVHTSDTEGAENDTVAGDIPSGLCTRKATDPVDTGPVELDPEVDELYARLLERLDEDGQAVERLLAYERQRTPAAPYSRLLRNALKRLNYEL